jgi:hypothetical protein
MAGLKGDENFEVRYFCNDCNPYSPMEIFSADDSEQVTQSWLIKGTQGENITWYWDSNYTKPVILGENVRTDCAAFISGKTYVFGLYGRIEYMNIKLKMGSNVPSAKDAGSVYFADDHLYYDKTSGIRYEIIPSRLDSGTITVADCCFIGGTKILMADNTYKNIELIKKGDMVISYNLHANEFYPAIVHSLIVNHNTINMAIIYLEDGTSLEMNEYHPIFTLNGFHSITNYNNYNTLVEGDLVKTISGYKKIVKIHRFTCQRPMITYNLDVRDSDEIIDDDSNDTFIANNIVVHNAGCPT